MAIYRWFEKGLQEDRASKEVGAPCPTASGAQCSTAARAQGPAAVGAVPNKWNSHPPIIRWVAIHATRRCSSLHKQPAGALSYTNLAGALTYTNYSQVLTPTQTTRRCSSLLKQLAGAPAYSNNKLSSSPAQLGTVALSHSDLISLNNHHSCGRYFRWFIRTQRVDMTLNLCASYCNYFIRTQCVHITFYSCDLLHLVH